MVWIPERSVLFAGDLLFNGGTPFLLSGSVLGAIDVLENFLRPLGAQTIVPGHGPVAARAHRARARLPPVRRRPRGGGPRRRRRAARAGPGHGPRPVRGLARPERIVGNLHRAYADLAGPAEARGGPVNFIAALTDMVAYNGGRPLTCLA